ncbi:hypothetical protein INR49_003034, partial [Caranx melampygus]
VSGVVRFNVVEAYHTSQFELSSIDVPEEQQNLPRSALLPVREEQVVAGDAQGASARGVKGLSEHNILHIGGLDVVSKLHQPATSDKTKVWTKLREICLP